MFVLPKSPRTKVSTKLRDLHVAQGTTVEAVVAQLGNRTYGMAILLMTAFNLIPLLNNIFGIVTIFIALQMVFGMKKIWLPKRVLNIELPEEKTKQALNTAANGIARLERWCRPRWHWTEAPIFDLALALMIVVLAVLVVAIPIPFANMPPAIAIGVIGLGLAVRDGLFQLLGALLGLVLIGFFHGLLVRAFA